MIVSTKDDWALRCDECGECDMGRTRKRPETK